MIYEPSRLVISKNILKKLPTHLSHRLTVVSQMRLNLKLKQNYTWNFGFD